MSMRYIAPLRDSLKHLQARVPARRKVSPLTRPDVDAESFGMKMAEHVAGALGTWRFIGGLALFIMGWMAWNILAPQPLRFDPWPFMGDNLFMSGLAALTGPILLIAAAAGAARDHRQSQRIEQLAWDNDKHCAEIKDTQGVHGQKLDTVIENVADLHAALADLAARISPPVSAPAIVEQVTKPRSHHKKVTVTT